MIFGPPSWVPSLPDVPNSITLEEFMNSESHGRRSFSTSRNPYTCGLTGKTYTPGQVKERIGLLSRAIAKRMGWKPNEGTPWEKVAAVYSVNTIDYTPLTHAVHRLSGIVTPASAAYSASELEHQIRSSGATVMFTCLPLLETALKATRACKIPDDKVFILECPGQKWGKEKFLTVDNLVEEGKAAPQLEALKWSKGQGARQAAYLCYSSGTSGLPKAVMISHVNVIANVLQYNAYESVARKRSKVDTQVSLGLLPYSHIYALVVIVHGAVFRGDGVVVLPRFELPLLLKAIQDHKIEHMCLVPPIIIQLLRNHALCSQYNLDSVRFVYTGAAPLGKETAEALLKTYPKWGIGQGYGMTETSTVVSSTSEHDVFLGSSGSLLPGVRAKIIGFDGKEVGYKQPGELVMQSPSVVLGYLNNEKANAETFVWDNEGRWIKTGDEAMVMKVPSGNEHLFILDRIKELIKVKGHQVAPAELEAHLLSHPFVSDCAVIQVPDDMAGEVPKAFVVKTAATKGKPDDEVTKAIHKHVQDHKARHKWLKGGTEFVDIIPKSPSGKILRRLLREKEKAARTRNGAKL